MRAVLPAHGPTPCGRGLAVCSASRAGSSPVKLESQRALRGRDGHDRLSDPEVCAWRDNHQCNELPVLERSCLLDHGKEHVW